jgi:hypothetical protein
MKLSISDMAHMVGKSDRTISRWLQEGGPLASAVRLENGLYEVAEGVLLAQMPQSTEVMILERLAAIEEQLAAIREQLARAGPPRPAEKQVAPPRARPRPERPATDTPAQAALPEMSEREPGEPMPLADLAAQLGVTRPTIAEHLAKGHYESTFIAGKHYFTDEQAEQARAYHAAHPPRGKH